MNLLIIWLIISVVCTGLVLLGIKFAPNFDDEPLNIIEDTKRRLERGHAVQERRSHRLPDGSHLNGSQPPHSSRPQSEVRSGAPAKLGLRRPLHPKLSNFAINRPEESQS